MSEYTPTTDEVRLDWECLMSEGGASRESLEDADWDSDKRVAQFDRWLNEIRAEAWDRGFDAGEADVLMHEVEGYDAECLKNPYRPNEK